MDYEKARHIINTSNKNSPHFGGWTEEEMNEACKILIKEAYLLLEDENFHVEIIAIERLTGVTFE